MTTRFTFLTGDSDWLSYGGKWISPKYNNGDFDYYLVRTLINMEEATGGEAEFKYRVQLSAVVPSEVVNYKSVMENSNMDADDDRQWKNIPDIERVQMLADYGLYAHMKEWEGNNYKKLFKQCTDETTLVTGLFGFYMDRYQNGLRVTGWDFVRGHVHGTLLNVS